MGSEGGLLIQQLQSPAGRRSEPCRMRWFVTQRIAKLCEPLPQGAAGVKTCMDSRDDWASSGKGKSVAAY